MYIATAILSILVLVLGGMNIRYRILVRRLRGRLSDALHELCMRELFKAVDGYALRPDAAPVETLMKGFTEGMVDEVHYPGLGKTAFRVQFDQSWHAVSSNELKS